MKLIDKNTASILAHSSLLIGEAVFTSVLYYNQQFIFLDDHLERWLLGANFLFPELNLNHAFLTEVKSELKKEQKLFNDNRSVRITLTRQGYFIDFRPWVEANASLTLGLSENKKVRSLKPSFLKLSNYALEFYELRNSQVDDLIYLDTDQNITEATTSNIFILDEANQFITPPASSTVLSGILRLKLLEHLNLSGNKVLEQELKVNDLYRARAIFLTNSIKGIRIVNKFDEKLFEKSLLLERVVTEIGRYGERIK